jgi:hypothetical protein
MWGKPWSRLPEAPSRGQCQVASTPFQGVPPNWRLRCAILAVVCVTVRTWRKRLGLWKWDKVIMGYLVQAT